MLNLIFEVALHYLITLTDSMHKIQYNQYVRIKCIARAEIRLQVLKVIYYHRIFVQYKSRYSIRNV